jgi:hypothetical protein
LSWLCSVLVQGEIEKSAGGPAPGASNVIMVVFRSFAFAERTDPDVARLTANPTKSALPVAIPCIDALFVLLVLFTIFSNRGGFALIDRRPNDLPRDFSGSRNVHVARGQKECLSQGL